MEVYQTDDEGFFINITIADPDPLVPGNFLIPAGCVTVVPPNLDNNQRAKWDGNGWIVIGEPEPETIPEPTPEEITSRIIENFRIAIDSYVDATARSKGYNSAAHCASYVASTHAPWAAEAAAFISWRDQVWLSVFSQLEDIQNGLLPIPESIEQVISTLPVIVWP